MLRERFTEEQEETIRSMRADNRSFPEIAEKVGRSVKSCSMKWANMRTRDKTKPVVRKLEKRQALVESNTHAPAQRPMVAFIGTPSEITKSIRELFS